MINQKNISVSTPERQNFTTELSSVNPDWKEFVDEYQVILGGKLIYETLEENPLDVEYRQMEFVLKFTLQNANGLEGELHLRFNERTREAVVHSTGNINRVNDMVDADWAKSICYTLY